MLCSEMQHINSGTSGTRNRENDPGCALPRVPSKVGELRRVASVEDATLSNAWTRGSNPKCAMSMWWWNAIRMQCYAVKCSIYIVGHRARETEKTILVVHYHGCYLRQCEPRRVASAEDITLSNAQTRGSNPKRAMSVWWWNAILGLPLWRIQESYMMIYNEDVVKYCV